MLDPPLSRPFPSTIAVPPPYSAAMGFRGANQAPGFEGGLQTWELRADAVDVKRPVTEKQIPPQRRLLGLGKQQGGRSCQARVGAQKKLKRKGPGSAARPAWGRLEA